MKHLKMLIGLLLRGLLALAAVSTSLITVRYCQGSWYHFASAAPLTSGGSYPSVGRR
jgi:hypothetical protein